MKKNFYFLLCCSLCFQIATINAQKTNAVTYANTSLSNLTSPTSINQSLLVDKDNTHNIGSITKGWKNIYLDSAVYLGGSRFLAYKTGTGISNIAAGTGTLSNNTTGGYNTAIGSYALTDNTRGSSNTATGDGALAFNTTGNFNTANGSDVLYYNGTGNYNTAAGEFAMYYNQTGSSNVAIGSYALYYSTEANDIVAVGSDALLNLGVGSSACTAIGSGAGVQNTSGINNTYVGYHAGNTVTIGGSNTIIGYGSDVNSNSYNATAIGNYAVAAGSNHVRVGNSSVISIGGQVGWTNFSDERIKSNIKQNVPGLAFINLLKPVTYNFDIDKQQQIMNKKDTVAWKEKYDIQKITFTGFLAQDVESAAKKINYDFSGVDAPANDKDVYGLRYADFVVPLAKAVQELSAKNDALQNQNTFQQDQINNLQKEIDDLKAIIVSGQSAINDQQSLTLSSASLSQNVPNPFNNATTISYSLPEQFSSAKIFITDKNGNVLKQVNLLNNKGSISVDAATLTSGAYQYTLYVDGKMITSRQMERIK